MEPVYQCRYSNASQTVGSQVTSGWQVTFASPGIPKEAYQVCVKLQAANSPICARAAEEDGTPLNLLELVGDGNYLYVLQTQFGLTDRLGRPNMQSHAVIFHTWNNEPLLKNPNYFLALHPVTFQKEDDTVIYQSRSLSLEEAMVLAGLDRVRYAALVKCVFAQLESRKASRPLYIQHDGNPRRLQGILHCLCAGMPRYLVRNLRVASCPTANDSGKDLVFSRAAKTRGRFFVPQTGENNVLTNRLEQTIRRSGYVDYAVEQLPLEEFPAFFEALEDIASSMGDASSAWHPFSKLAFQFWKRQDDAVFSDTELESNFSDALRLPPSGNRILENVLTRMLREANRRKLVLPAESETLLYAWLDSARSDELKEAGRQYRKNR